MNAVTETAVSDWTEVITVIPDALSVPLNFSVVAGDTEITATWSPSQSNGGSVITQYVILSSADEFASSSSTTVPASDVLGDGSFSKVLLGMVNGVSYTLKVNAVTETAVSDWTEVITVIPLAVVVPEGAPDAPFNLVVQPGDTKIRLFWERTLDSSVTSVTDYKVTVTSPDGQIEKDYDYGDHSTLNLNQWINNLVNGVTYTLKVQAKNSAGYSAFSESVSTSPFTAPSVPLNFSVVAGDTEITATWSSSLDDGGFAITYHISSTDEFGSSSSTTVLASEVLGDGSFSKVLPGVNGVSYTLKVKAVTDAAESGWSNVETVIPFDVPDAPSGLQVESFSNRVQFYWERPIDNGRSIFAYKITITDGNGNETEKNYNYGEDHTTVNYDQPIGSLDSSVTYTFKIQAENLAGYSAFSETISAIPL